MAAHNAWQEQKSWSTSVCFYPDRRLLKKTNSQSFLIKYLHNCTMTSQLQIREEKRRYWRSFILSELSKSEVQFPFPCQQKQCVMFSALSIGLLLCMVAEFRYSLPSHFETEFRYSRRSHTRIPNSGRGYNHTDFRYYLRPQWRTTGTVYVRTYKQFSYCLRSNLQTIQLLSTSALTNNSGTVYVRTY